MTPAETIKISADFSEAPGARHRADGPKSGQEFLEDLLRPKFLAAKEAKGKLFVDLDDTWGYASSFVSGSFGMLAKEFGASAVRQHIVFKSEEDPLLLETVYKEIDIEGAAEGEHA
jgi:STAS-like domain of unknown function (DUF4325)